jgi:hypothetical protein
MVAIKKICNVFDSRVDAKRTFRELRLLRHLDHENVRVSSPQSFCFFPVFRRFLQSAGARLCANLRG